MSEQINEQKNTREKTERHDRPDRESRDNRDNRESRDNRDRGDRSDRGDKSDRSDRKSFKKKTTGKRKVCRFCAERINVDYINIRVLRSFVTERAKIVPCRISGTCAIHQRQLTIAIKKARMLAFLPFTSAHN